MEHTLTMVFGPYWPILLFVLFGGSFLAWIGTRKKHKANIARTTADARQHGMDYVPPGGGDRQGTHRFSGTIQGVAWTAEVTLLSSEVDDGMVTRSHSSVSYTRWTAPDAGTSGGELLLMALPEGVRPQPAKANSGGFFGGLASMAAQAAFQGYIRGNFGNARGSSLSITPENHLLLPADAFGLAFTAFSNQPELLQSLSPTARDWLLKGCNEKTAFLWDPQGLSLTWPTAQIAPEEVAASAKYGAVLVSLLGTAALAPDVEATP
jgi:hypothetical protein